MHGLFGYIEGSGAIVLPTCWVQVVAFAAAAKTSGEGGGVSKASMSNSTNNSDSLLGSPVTP